MALENPLKVSKRPVHHHHSLAGHELSLGQLHRARLAALLQFIDQPLWTRPPVDPRSRLLPAALAYSAIARSRAQNRAAQTDNREKAERLMQPSDSTGGLAPSTKAAARRPVRRLTWLSAVCSLPALVRSKYQFLPLSTCFPPRVRPRLQRRPGLLYHTGTLRTKGAHVKRARDNARERPEGSGGKSRLRPREAKPSLAVVVQAVSKEGARPPSAKSRQNQAKRS